MHTDPNYDFAEIRRAISECQKRKDFAEALHIAHEAIAATAQLDPQEKAAAAQRLRLMERTVRMEQARGTVQAARQTQDHALGFAKDFGLAPSPWVEISLRFTEKRIPEAWELAQQAQLGSEHKPDHIVQRIMARLAIEAEEPELAQQMAESLLAEKSDDMVGFTLFFEAQAILEPSEIAPKAMARLRDGTATADQILGLNVHFRYSDMTAEDYVQVLHLAEQVFPENDALKRMRQRRQRSGEQRMLTGNSAQSQLQQVKEQMQERAVFHDIAAARLQTMEAVTHHDLTRPVMAQSYGSNVAYSPYVENGDVMLRFAGLADTGVSPFIDAMASIAGLNVLYLNDRKRLFYCAGIPELGGTLDDTITNLRGRIDAVGAGRKLTMFGSSAGGYGALLYGVLLGADRVLALSPPVTALRSVSHHLNDYRARALLHRMEKRVPPEPRDLKLQFDKAAKVPRIDLVYGAQNDIDRSHAEFIADHPNVNLYPLKDYDSHNTIGYLSGLGLLPSLFRGDMQVLEGLLAS